MNYKYLLNAIATALVAAAESFRRSADAYQDDSAATVAPTPTATPTATVAPTPTATVAPTDIANAPVDADGLPWDARIHASTKTKTQKGAWTQKKGVDENVRNSVLAELRAMYPEVAAAPVTTAAPVGITAAPPVVAVPTIVATPYSKLVDWLAKNTGNGKSLTDDWVQQTLTSNNVSLGDLAKPELAATATALHDAFRGVLKTMGVAEIV